VRKRTGELREANRRLRGDIAERRRAEADLRRQKEILQKIFDHSPVMVNFIDRNGRIQMVNREWERVLGWTLAEIRKKKLDIMKEAYPEPRDRRAVMEFVERANGEWMDFKTRIKSGRVIDTTWALVRLSDDTRIGIGQDITDRKRAEEALRSSRRSLRVLAGYLQSVREAEKSRIARELHDEVGQALTGIKLNLERSARTRPAASKDGLDGIVALVNQLIGRVRDLTLDLRPPMLDDLGLLPALRWHFDRYAAQFDIQVDFTHRAIEGARFSRDIETAAYRIAQEALTNVARHAGVRRVKVRISANGAAVRIRIEDQGAGFAHGALSPGVTAGLSGMRERAALLGGRLEIDSAPGAGTVVAAELPLRVKPDGDDSAQSARVEVGS
jgi:PAS domain S-box-containing protein